MFEELSRLARKRLVRWAAIAPLVAAVAIGGCARLHGGSGPTRGASIGDRPFGGAPTIDLPPSALAMGAYLKAEVATDNGDHEEAFRDYEEAVKYDPHNAALRVKLADLYVREGRLKDALTQAQEAIALDPGFVRGHLLNAGISSALGDDASATEQYQKVLELAPKTQEAYLFLGTLAAKQGDYKKAEDIFSQLIALDPSSFLGYYYAGRVCAAAQHYADADRYYQKALDLSPQSQLLLLDVAVLRELQNRPKDAIAIYQRILQTDPNNDDVHHRLAELYGDDKKVDAAVAALHRRDQLATTPADTRTKIGLLFFERGDFDRAATEFNLVLGAEPDNDRVRYYLGIVYTELNENEKALATFDQIPASDSRYADSRLQEANLYDKQSDYAHAIAKLTDAMGKRPNDTEIMGFLVSLDQEKKDYAGAIDLAKKMIALEPHNDKFHFTLGALYDVNQQKDLGVVEMRKAIAINPSNAPALNYLGYTYAESGAQLDEAEELIKRALVIEPDDGFYVDSLGWVYYQQGNYSRAVAELERAVNLTGNDPTITEHLGDAYRKLGKLREARHQYEDALVKAQDTDQVKRLKNKLNGLVDTEQHASH